MKISYLIFLGFLLILILFSITTYINFQQTEKVRENSEWFAQSTTVVRHTNRFQRNILNMVSGLRGYLFTGEKYFIEAYDSAALENESILKDLDLLIPDSSLQRKALMEIRKMDEQWIDAFALPLIKAKKSSGISDSSLVAFNTLYREKLMTGTEVNFNRILQKKFRDFSNYEFDLRDQRKATLDKSIKLTGRISFLLNSFSILIGLCVAGFLAKQISARILKMVNMANSIAAGNYEVSMQDKSNDELSRLATSLNHMAHVLKENISLLKRKNNELDQFAHIVSHDMKAPLRGIDNVVTWIEEDHSQELSPKIKEYIQLIKGRLVRAENLIQGILSYARIGKEMQYVEEVNLQQLLADIRDNLSIRPGLTFNFERNLPIIRTEKIPLQQVLTNLIDNAIKYHDKAEGQISVYTELYDHSIQFFVKDDGPGISKNYHDKIFVIFQTLTERDTFESTGVGLAIVKKILDDRQQKITLTSELGNGSIFSFTWPKL
jgi:signal transduction histidine kinase